MNIEKEFVPYEQALELKEIGFDEPCFTWYWDDIGMYNGLEFGNHNKNINYVSAPTFSQAFRWFREKHDMLANVYSNASGFLFEWHDTIGGTHRYDSGFDGPNDSGCWDTYEEAELECLKKLIETIKNKTA